MNRKSANPSAVLGQVSHGPRLTKLGAVLILGVVSLPVGFAAGVLVILRG